MTTSTYPASDKQKAYIEKLAGERVITGIVIPADLHALSSREASALIDLLQVAPKPTPVHVPEGYYVTSDGTCYRVLPSKTHPGQTWVKVLAVNGNRASWQYLPGGMRDLVGLHPLTVEEAARLGRKHGVCMVCAKTLMDDVRKGSDGLTSIERGIGPVCMKRLTPVTNPPETKWSSKYGTATVSDGVTDVPEHPEPLPKGGWMPTFPAPKPVQSSTATVVYRDQPHNCEDYDGECLSWPEFHGSDFIAEREN